MAPVNSDFGITARLQHLMCLIGQKEVFEEGSETFKELLQIEVSDNQIKRVSEHYGKVLDPLIKANCKEVIPKLITKEESEYTYSMFDGSMLLTRDKGWKEIKLGRLFTESHHIDIQPTKSIILESIFVSHLGKSKDFFLKLERFLTATKHLVVIGDGAKWIWNWVEDNYPGAVQILDFYHALEKLCEFAVLQFSLKEKREEWIEKQKNRLLENQVHEVIDELKGIRSRNKEANKKKQKVIQYYQTHEDRMEYKTYREKGLLIGSGPIESAHRNVIQHRMKLSGQRWSKVGAQAIANLRCYKKGDNWSVITNLIKKAA